MCLHHALVRSLDCLVCEDSLCAQWPRDSTGTIIKVNGCLSAFVHLSITCTEVAVRFAVNSTHCIKFHPAVLVATPSSDNQYQTPEQKLTLNCSTMLKDLLIFIGCHLQKTLRSNPFNQLALKHIHSDLVNTPLIINITFREKYCQI